MTRGIKSDAPTWLKESGKNYGISESEFSKLDEYAVAVPDVVDEIVYQAAPMAVERIAVRLSEVMSTEEADAVAQFFESPSGLEFSKAMDEVDGQLDEASAVAEVMSNLQKEVLRDFIAFSQSPQGRAFMRERATIEGVVQKELSRGIQIPLNARILHDLCSHVSRAYCRS